jgi:hypothetical protein
MRRLALAALAAAILLHAQTFDQELNKELHTIKGYCENAPKFNLQLITQCGQAIFNGKPLHLDMQMFPPGNGMAIGLAYTHGFTFGEQWKNEWEIGGRGSFQGAWNGHMLMTFRLQKADTGLGPPANPFHTVKDHLLIHFFAEGQQLPKLDFYGEGANSNLNSLALYSERDTRVGLAIDKPLTWWLNVGAKVEGIWPDIYETSDSTHKSVAAVYSAAQAPGIESQPPFTHYQFFVRPHLPNQEPYDLLYKIGYEFYQDHGRYKYSFRRFRADLLHNLYLERANGARRRDSILSIYGRLSLADTSAGQAVPFYLQDTLGGSDINGDPSLRSFADYRFRAPNAVAIETEFNRRLWRFLGLMAFYDTGMVAVKRSDLDFGNFRHSFGGGLTLWSTSRVVFKAYVGFGGGEGHHTFTGILPTPGPVNSPYRSF